MYPTLPFRKPRSRAKEGPAFVFVESDDTHSVSPKTQVTRAVIRSQAARSGRKRQRNESTILETVETRSEAGALAPTQQGQTRPPYPRKRKIASYILNLGPPSQPSYTGYEAIRVKYNFDITDLTNFTDVDLAINAYHLLQDQPARLVNLLCKPYSSFLTYLPSRYGSSPCLDDAMHCVAARAGQMLGVAVNKSILDALYGRAIKSLHTAITDRVHFPGADVHCATRLLVLYELIGLPDANRWNHHNRCGIKLVEGRGPKRHISRFDWTLLKSQGSSIIIDEMYRHKSSVFESPEWQRFFQHVSNSETDTDVRLWWEFFGVLAFMPGILKDMRTLCKDPHAEDQYLTKRFGILERASRMLINLYNGHVLYQHRAPHPPSLFDLPFSAESPDRIRLREFFLYVTMYLSRVRATLALSEIERATSEVEAQKFAAQALLIEKMTILLDPAMNWHLAQRNALAHSVIQTRDEWLIDKECGVSGEGLKSFLAERWLKWEDSWREGVLSKELGPPTH